MSEQLRIRLDGGLIEKADEVCREIGITPAAAVSMFFAQLVKLRALPFRPSNFPALEEYGATLEQAEAAAAAAMKELDADRKAGRMKTFNGKLPR